MGIFPVVPGHSLSTGLAVKVQSIQVGMVATVIPPGTFIIRSTVASAFIIIITIFGGKCHTTMITKRISSSAWKKKKVYLIVKQVCALAMYSSKAFNNNH